MKTEMSMSHDNLGRNIAARLRDGTDNLPNDISERLKAARMQALAKRKVIKLELATGVASQSDTLALHLNGDDRSLWNRIASLLPLFALVVGLMIISVMQDQWRAQELADIDTELLTDDLPPSAYTDPGFVHFLASNPRD